MFKHVAQYIDVLATMFLKKTFVAKHILCDVYTLNLLTQRTLIVLYFYF